MNDDRVKMEQIDKDTTHLLKNLEVKRKERGKEQQGAKKKQGKDLLCCIGNQLGKRKEERMNQMES